MEIASDSYRYYKDYHKDYVDNKFKLLIKDLKSKLNDPRLTDEKRMKLAEKIAALEHAGKSDFKEVHLKILALDVVKFAAGLFGGSVGSGVFSFFASKPKRSLQRRGRVRIVPARKIAGQRRPQRRGKRKTQEKISYMPDVASIQDAADAVIRSVAFGVGVGVAWKLSARSISYIRSFF